MIPSAPQSNTPTASPSELPAAPLPLFAPPRRSSSLWIWMGMVGIVVMLLLLAMIGFVFLLKSAFILPDQTVDATCRMLRANMYQIDKAVQAKGATVEQVTYSCINHRSGEGSLQFSGRMQYTITRSSSISDEQQNKTFGKLAYDAMTDRNSFYESDRRSEPSVGYVHRDKTGMLRFIVRLSVSGTVDTYSSTAPTIAPKTSTEPLVESSEYVLGYIPDAIVQGYPSAYKNRFSPSYSISVYHQKDGQRPSPMTYANLEVYYHAAGVLPQYYGGVNCLATPADSRCSVFQKTEAEGEIYMHNATPSDPSAQVYMYRRGDVDFVVTMYPKNLPSNVSVSDEEIVAILHGISKR